MRNPFVWLVTSRAPGNESLTTWEYCRVRASLIRHDLRLMVTDDLPLWIANHLPRAIVTRCYYRVGAHATTGQWGSTNPADLSFFEAAERWDGDDSPASADGPEPETPIGEVVWSDGPEPDFPRGKSETVQRRRRWRL